MTDTIPPQAPTQYNIDSLNPTGNIKYQFLDPKAEWKADDFYGAIEKQGEFAKLKPSDKKGLETILGAINAPVVATWTPEKVEAVRDQITNEASKRIRTYSESNIPGLVGTLTKGQAEDYASSIPLFENKEDEKYSFIKTESERLGKRLAELRTSKGASEYMQKLTEKMDQFSRQFWISHAKEHLEAVVNACQKYLTVIVSKYDAKKLITKNFSVGKKTLEAFAKDKTEIQKKMQEEANKLVNKEEAERIVEAEKSQGHQISLEKAVAHLASQLPAKVQNKIGEKYAPEFKALEKKYEASMPAIEDYGKIVQNLMQEVYQTIAQKKAYEKAKKKAEEKAKVDGKNGTAREMPQEDGEELEEVA